MRAIPEKPPKQQATVLGLFDHPLRRDWLTYLAALGMLLGFGMAVRSYGGVAFGDPRFVEDACLSVLLQFVLLGVVPGLVRRSIRSRRDGAAA